MLVVVLSKLTSASVPTGASRSTPGNVTDPQENKVWISALRQSQFSPVLHSAAYASCEVSEPPEALATPDPVVEVSGPSTRITVSFIVGTDGRVHSLFILEGNSPSEDGRVLKAVRSWRYRPAMCNGVPVDAEAKIQFRLR
jgi:TonB family protein